MRKSWGLLPKILDGQKTIESRWLMNRSAPWGKVQAGDTVYFKNSGEPVTARAVVAQALQFADLTPARVSAILDEYGAADGLASADLSHYKELFRNKKYCILVFLAQVEPVQPFRVSKHGFGLQAAWLVAGSIERL